MRARGAQKKRKAISEGSRVFSSTYWVYGPRTDYGLWRALAGQLPADPHGPGARYELPSGLQAAAILVKARF